MLREILLPWDSQPQEAVDVRPALNPITGLQPGMGRLVDTSGNPLTSVGSGITESVGPYGRELDFTSAGRLTRAGSVSGHPLSFVFACRVDGAGLHVLSSIATSADKTARVFGFDGTIYAQHIGATTSAAAQSGSVWNYGTYWTGVAVFRSPTDVSVYAQGNVGRSSAKTTTNVGALGTLTKITYGAYDGGSSLYNLDGSIALAQWLGVALTADEAWALVDQVWSVFAPQSIWVPVSAGGGATSTNLTGQSASHAHTSDSPTLTLSTTLSIADSTHAHTSDQVTLTTTGSVSLIAQDCTHAHTADSPTLTTQSALTVADSTHAHTSEQVTLSTTGSVSLTVQDATHAHTSDNATLTDSSIGLVAQDCTHAHASDAPALTLETWIDIADAWHVHTSQSPSLSIPGADQPLASLVGRSIQVSRTRPANVQTSRRTR